MEGGWPPLHDAPLMMMTKTEICQRSTLHCLEQNKPLVKGNHIILLFVVVVVCCCLLSSLLINDGLHKLHLDLTCMARMKKDSEIRCVLLKFRAIVLQATENVLASSILSPLTDEELRLRKDTCLSSVHIAS